MASFKFKYSFEFTFESETIRANLHGNKRILKWLPFWNKVYVEVEYENNLLVVLINFFEKKIKVSYFNPTSGFWPGLNYFHFIR